MNEVENCLKKCLDIAEQAQYTLYSSIAQRELEILEKHKEIISTNLESNKRLSPEEQQKRIQIYFKDALKLFEKD